MVCIALAIYLALLSVGTRASERWYDSNTTHFDFFLGNGHLIHIHLGQRFMHRYGGIAYAPATKPSMFPPLHISVMYRTHPAQFGTELLALALPIWPLPLSATCVGGVALLLHWRARR